MIRAEPQALGGRRFGDVDMVVGDSIKYEVVGRPGNFLATEKSRLEILLSIKTNWV